MGKRLSLEQFQSLVANLDAKTEKAAIRGFQSAGAYFMRTVVIEIGQSVPRAAVDTNELRNSVDLELVHDGAIVSVEAPHAAVIENGRRPGGRMPPVQAIEDWMRRKGMLRGKALADTKKSVRRAMKQVIADANATVGKAYARKAINAEVQDRAYRAMAFAMARAIQKNGIAPRHYFRKAWDRSIDRMVLLINMELAKSAGWRPTPKAKATLKAMFTDGAG